MEQYTSAHSSSSYFGSRYEQGIDSKIVIMGNSGVGKTSLLQRYTQNKFDPKNTTSTSGAFFVTKKVYVKGLKVRLQLWDTAGQERFRSMAPMYYRGANAALLLYDITNASTFHDIRGWLSELKKNCSPELIIYIVGSKSDLHLHREVTSDLARLSLHNWFPPPPPPTPPPPPPPPSSATLSYIRPRFTSFPGLRSPLVSPYSEPTSPPNSAVDSFAAYLDIDNPRTRMRTLTGNIGGGGTAAGALTRSNTTGMGSRTPPLQHQQTSGLRSPPQSSALRSPPQHPSGLRSPPSQQQQQSFFASSFGNFGKKPGGGWNEIPDTSGSSNTMEGDEDMAFDEEEEGLGRHAAEGYDGDYGEDGREWGLSKGMELFEVSAKDDTGIQMLFDHLISAIIYRKDRIERENELKKRDSVFLSPPAWSAQAEEEEAREREKLEREGKSGWGSCC